VTIESFTDERVLTEDVQELMKKIEIRVDSSLPKNPDLRLIQLRYAYAMEKKSLERNCLRVDTGDIH
jgi:hypothetical protein